MLSTALPEVHSNTVPERTVFGRPHSTSDNETGSSPLPSDNWKVHLMRRHPGSHLWLYSVIPSDELKAAGHVRRVTGADFVSPANFDEVRFNSSQIDSVSVAGEPLSEEIKVTILYFIKWVKALL